MNVERKKKISKVVRDLYLYPYRSKSENVLRGGVWLVSWIVGVVVQDSANQCAMGGAYFIFALSLLLEFVPEGKMCTIPRIIHGIFCILLFFVSLGAFLLIFSDPTSSAEGMTFFWRFFSSVPEWGGWIIFLIILLSSILALFDAHRIFYDEDAVQKKDLENKRTLKRDQFMTQLTGTSKGGES